MTWDSAGASDCGINTYWRDRLDPFVCNIVFLADRQTTARWTCGGARTLRDARLSVRRARGDDRGDYRQDSRQTEYAHRLPPRVGDARGGYAYMLSEQVQRTQTFQRHPYQRLVCRHVQLLRQQRRHLGDRRVAIAVPPDQRGRPNQSFLTVGIVSLVCAITPPLPPARRRVHSPQQRPGHLRRLTTPALEHQRRRHYLPERGHCGPRSPASRHGVGQQRERRLPGREPPGSPARSMLETRDRHQANWQRPHPHPRRSIFAIQPDS